MGISIAFTGLLAIAAEEWTLPVTLVLFCSLALLVMLSHPSMPIGRRLKNRRKRKEQSFWEDILRQILLRAQEGQPITEESLAGALGKPVATIRRVLLRMGDYGLVEIQGTDLELTAHGRQWALHVLRAHRLWESYLADEARLPMEYLHRQAEQEEHRLSPTDLDALDAQLGHPIQDPHGDPIPTVAGEFRSNRGAPLSKWYRVALPDHSGSSLLAAEIDLRVVHVEDEPAELFARLLGAGVRPGTHLKIHTPSPEGLHVEVDGVQTLLAPELLASVEVEPNLVSWAKDPGVERLSDLKTGVRATVVALSDAIRGFSRRRLMDFGVTTGASIQPVLDNPFGDPRAYKVRGATIGIRKEQADLIWVRPLDPAPPPSLVSVEGTSQ
jgi:DtxR family transcriptional regulator, Mn-dependent transcriptional regulator